MKKAIFLLLLSFGVQRVLLAQTQLVGTFPQSPSSANLQFSINFSAIPNSPGTNQPSGIATYFQSGWDYGAASPATNIFFVSINLGTNQATDGWIFQKEDNGSFTSVMELTNEIYNVALFPGSLAGIASDAVGAFPGNSGLAGVNYYSQYWQLTIDQIQNLLAGKWYAKVEYGDDKYLGNLVPTNISPPQAAITVSPTTILPLELGAFPNILTDVLIAPNQTATVILNGSESTDPFSLSLQFMWLDGNNFLAATATTTNSLQIGTHLISLEVNDGYNSDIAYLALEVVSLGEAAVRLDSMVEQSNLNRTKKRFLTSIVSQAENAFNRNNTVLGVRQLQNFQNQVRFQLMRTDGAMASWLIEAAQEIIDAVGQQQNHRFNFR